MGKKNEDVKPKSQRKRQAPVDGPVQADLTPEVLAGQVADTAKPSEEDADKMGGAGRIERHSS